VKTELCVIGAGPAGLMAAIMAGRRGIRTWIVERNPTAGRKLLKTGRGRCNLTHVGRPEDLTRACEPYGRFLRYAFHTFGPDVVRRFFHEHGLQTKVEADGCVFPVTDRAADVKAVLLEQARRAGARFVFGRRISLPIERRDDGFALYFERDETHRDRDVGSAPPGNDEHGRMESPAIRTLAVILATGGASWPRTGSTGDGYALAAGLGHAIIGPRPALVPLVTREKWPGALQGLGVEHVRIRPHVDGRPYRAAGRTGRIKTAGPMMFTQDGIGGPAVLNLSRHLADVLGDPAAGRPGSPGSDRTAAVELHIDLADGLTSEALNQKLMALCRDHPRRVMETLLAEWYPRALAGQLCELAGCAGVQAAQLSKSARHALVRTLKDLVLHVVRSRPLAEATITRGGVDPAQIDPTTMQSTICPGLYFAGEIINADGPCGGYNLQIAFATGALAGQSVPARS